MSASSLFGAYSLFDLSLLHKAISGPLRPVVVPGAAPVRVRRSMRLAAAADVKVCSLLGADAQKAVVSTPKRSRVQPVCPGAPRAVRTSPVEVDDEVVVGKLVFNVVSKPAVVVAPVVPAAPVRMVSAPVAAVKPVEAAVAVAVGQEVAVDVSGSVPAVCSLLSFVQAKLLQSAPRTPVKRRWGRPVAPWAPQQQRFRSQSSRPPLVIPNSYYGDYDDSASTPVLTSTISSPAQPAHSSITSSTSVSSSSSKLSPPVQAPLSTEPPRTPATASTSSFFGVLAFISGFALVDLALSSTPSPLKALVYLAVFSALPAGFIFSPRAVWHASNSLIRPAAPPEDPDKLRPLLLPRQLSAIRSPGPCASNPASAEWECAGGRPFSGSTPRAGAVHPGAGNPLPVALRTALVGVLTPLVAGAYVTFTDLSKQSCCSPGDSFSERRHGTTSTRQHALFSSTRCCCCLTPRPLRHPPTRVSSVLPRPRPRCPPLGLPNLRHRIFFGGVTRRWSACLGRVPPLFGASLRISCDTFLLVVLVGCCYRLRTGFFCLLGCDFADWILPFDSDCCFFRVLTAFASFLIAPICRPVRPFRLAVTGGPSRQGTWGTCPAPPLVGCAGHLHSTYDFRHTFIASICTALHDPPELDRPRNRCSPGI
ncbi:hypothetical protein MIND_00213100 [Mycena indigotica]|uniref:Uncharacterized protein n=1 Tax=Mycena indigotica TaxID=2126181 RepID=A0A8H6T8P9_9AGAR|nr:uncharacterized protein MIND_00213100 [Mycena indigotica]KAF7312012.1 hypothetical protein MIND_00213100 [Mycena indigotica]